MKHRPLLYIETSVFGFVGKEGHFPNFQQEACQGVGALANHGQPPDFPPGHLPRLPRSQRKPRAVVRESYSVNRAP